MVMSNRLLGLISAMAASAALPCFAAQPVEKSPLLRELLACRAETDPQKRLACYDASSSKFEQAETKGEVVVVDRESARTMRRQAFGFSLPSLDIFDKVQGPEPIDKISSVVRSAHLGGGGKWVIELEDGAVWNQIDNEDMARDPKPGQKVEIRAAALGSYFLSVNGQRSFRAHRDR
jgi:hypothetical protein